jgi:hypothetical protein
MKKIYLLMMALVAFAVTSNAQPTCPAGYVAFKYLFSSPTPHCMIIVDGAPTGQTGWVMELVNFSGQLIPQFGTTSSFDVPINTGTGSANFIYDCNAPGFIEVQYVLLKHVVAGTPVSTCQISNIPAAGSLPIKLTSFSGRLGTDNAVNLDWTSAIEFDSYQYQVERSTDGKNFETVGTLKAAGASNSIIKYNFTDHIPTAGAYFYKLKQIDIDGKFEYSKVVYVNSKKGAGVITKVFPNPFNSEVQLIGATSADMAPGNISVYNISGQMIKYRLSGANAISIDESAAKGIYIIRLRNSSQQFKLVKE